MKLDSIKSVISKVFRDLNLKDQTRFPDMVEWGFEALQFIGTYNQMEDKCVDLEVKEYKTELPCDFQKLIMISHCDRGMRFEENMPYYEYQGLRDDKHWGPIAPTYDIKYPFIHTSFRDGTITLQYLAQPMDEDGLPMIPDSISFKTALFWYIVKQLILGGMEAPFTYNFADEQWVFYCGQAKGEINMPSLAQMENIKNTSQRLLPLRYDYQRMFKDSNVPEWLTLKGWKYGR